MTLPTYMLNYLPPATPPVPFLPDTDAAMLYLLDAPATDAWTAWDTLPVQVMDISGYYGGVMPPPAR